MSLCRFQVYCFKMHHLAAAAASNSASTGNTLTNSRHLPDYKIGASNLILDGTPINHGNTLSKSSVCFPLYVPFSSCI